MGVLGNGTGVDVSVFGGWLASHVVESEGTQHVFVDDGAHVHPIELWWGGGDAVRAADLSKQAEQPKLSGGPLASHVFVEEGTQHVFTAASGQIDGASVFGHVCEFFWRGGEPAQLVNLTVRAGGAPAPEPGAKLTSHVVEGPYARERSQHVFYLAGREIFELRWGADAVTTLRGLIGRSSGERGAAASAPATHVDPDGTQHLFYTATEGHMFELTWQGDQDPVGTRAHRAQHRCRTRARRDHRTGEPPVPRRGHAPRLLRQRGPPRHRNVVVPGQDPHHEDLTEQTGAPLAFTDRPASHVFLDVSNQNYTQHVFYTSSAQLIELWWRA